MIPILITIIVTVFIMIVARNLAPPEKKVERLGSLGFELGSEQFRRETDVLLGAPIVPGNRIEVLKDGGEIFPAMIEAIQSAQKTICFETFIYWTGDIGKDVAMALAERAREGVEVNVLIDWMGSKIMGEEEEEIMTEAGVNFQVYRPLNWYHISRMNHRTHRKILVVDGELGFTGGVGIADQWALRKKKLKKNASVMERQWRDYHFRVRGPIVLQMQSVFVNNWVKATGFSLHGKSYFPKIEAEGKTEIQCFHSSPTEGAESVRLMFLYMIETSKETLEISAAYFVPDRLMRDALISAAKRGVKIRVILPGKNNDMIAVAHASRSLWGELIQGGIRIFRYRPSMYHSKAVIADGKVVSVGSANFDNRSFRLNDEMNLNIYDEEFGRKMRASFEEDVAQSSECLYEEWAERSMVLKITDHFFALFKSQL